MVTAFRWWVSTAVVLTAGWGCHHSEERATVISFREGTMYASDTMAAAFARRPDFLFLEIRYDDRYPYQNLWLRFQSRRVDTTLDVQLYRADGFRYGRRMGPYARMRIMLPTALIAERPDTLHIIPYMRPDRLPGIWQWRLIYPTASAP